MFLNTKVVSQEAWPASFPVQLWHASSKFDMINEDFYFKWSSQCLGYRSIEWYLDPQPPRPPHKTNLQSQYPTWLFQIETILRLLIVIDWSLKIKMKVTCQKCNSISWHQTFFNTMNSLHVPLLFSRDILSFGRYFS